MSIRAATTCEEGIWQYCNYGYDTTKYTSFDDCMKKRGLECKGVKSNKMARYKYKITSELILTPIPPSVNHARATFTTTIPKDSIVEGKVIESTSDGLMQVANKFLQFTYKGYTYQTSSNYDLWTDDTIIESVKYTFTKDYDVRDKIVCKKEPCPQGNIIKSFKKGDIAYGGGKAYGATQYTSACSVRVNYIDSNSQDKTAIIPCDYLTEKSAEASAPTDSFFTPKTRNILIGLVAAGVVLFVLFGGKKPIFKLNK
jgi:hypothetical protein